MIFCFIRKRRKGLHFFKSDYERGGGHWRKITSKKRDREEKEFEEDGERSKGYSDRSK